MKTGLNWCWNLYK